MLGCDYLLRPVACTTGGYGLFDDATLQRLCFVRAAFEADIGLDALARLCRALDAEDGNGALHNLPCCGSSSNAGARPWPASKCSWPTCRPSRPSKRRVCHEQPRALADRDTQAVHRLPVGRTGRADLPLPFANSGVSSRNGKNRILSVGAGNSGYNLQDYVGVTSL